MSQTAESLEHAAALPESGAYDVVLLDLAADEPHALDALCTWFQTQAAPAPHIIAVTGADSADLRDSCLATQGVVQLRRPLTRDALAAALAAAAVSPCRADADFNPLTWSEWLRVFGERGLTEVVAVMTADLGEQQRRHAAAAQAGDLYALRQIAHALRGASLQFGAEALADLCNRAESAALAGDGPQALSLGKQMMTRHTALVARMQRQSGLLQRA
ncbi:Hpt domain-containing protein [Hydrocarboniphaga sp.]|uniref:Hpt domain-containing protein n=1 Tax=Hydrocarboniphaga sp. TaxID=2033016 RepID=UPI002624F3B5|nr:Hpt domain-containing protein [Hydrocarboniphaga sp.]